MVGYCGERASAHQRQTPQLTPLVRISKRANRRITQSVTVSVINSMDIVTKTTKH